MRSDGFGVPRAAGGERGARTCVAANDAAPSRRAGRGGGSRFVRFDVVRTRRDEAATAARRTAATAWVVRRRRDRLRDSHCGTESVRGARFARNENRPGGRRSADLHYIALHYIS